MIYKICRMYAHDEHEVKDLYQEVAFQLWRAFPSFEGRSKTKTWVYRIVLNTVILMG
ncbi:RNA polymerase sigma factor [Lewinella sp. LCG006]|uniref:RNA polymerase sigma factor n=1 Tax=Lewinella sp. LCG006 TaxID=3231911 RepID=UPI00345FD3C1